MTRATSETHTGSIDALAGRSALRRVRSSSGIVAGSLVSGVILAALLCLVVFPGATEPIITGSALLGFGAAGRSSLRGRAESASPSLGRGCRHWSCWSVGRR